MLRSQRSKSPITRWLEQADATSFSVYCIAAAFATYFCMYAFRKPFTAGTFADETLMGVGYKTVLVAAQVSGYTLSKFIGIKVISEMPAARRAVTIVGLIALAELALLGFALVPSPYNWPLLFINGLPLGMVFGLVLSYLEGRRMTEALTAGLCASFIVSSGFVKSIGRSLVETHGISEYWMPFLTGLIFVLPLAVSVFLLSQIPQPNTEDVALRSERRPMNREDRRSMFRRHAFGLSGLMVIYILLTIVRSIRDDFAVEIWDDLGHDGGTSVYAKSELAVMFGVVGINGLAICIRSNRVAFMSALGLIGAGFMLVLFSLWGHESGVLAPFAFMVIVGLGTYIPYVAFHTTVFERLIAAFRENGNIGYLMYLADATGYLGFVGVMASKNFLPKNVNYLDLFLSTTLWISLFASIVTAILVWHYLRVLPRVQTASIAPVTAPESA